MKYSKKQISEAIVYWNRQLQTIETIDQVFNQLNETSVSDISSINIIKDEIEQNVKDANDVKKFIDINDNRVKKSNNQSLKKIWNILKSIVIKGSKFIYNNWKIVTLIILATLIIFNPSGFIKGAGWIFEKILKLIMWLLGYTDGYSSAEAKELLKVTGNVPELEYKDIIDKYTNKPWFDDGTVGSF